MDWKTCQEQAESILASGIYHLQQISLRRTSWPLEAGNYLISYEKQPLYIGEAKNLFDRLGQQTRISTSTFYKTYSASLSSGIPAGLGIGDFAIQIMPHRFGRKEIEEFGIVNLPTCLNKFQKNKRQRFNAYIDPDLWDVVQTSFDKLLGEGEAALLEQPALIWFEAQSYHTPGLYYVEDSYNRLLYIGESSSILERYKTHGSQTYFSALRRHIGTELLGFKLIEHKGKKRY